MAANTTDRIVAADYFVLNNNYLNVNLRDPSQPFHFYLDNIEERIFLPIHPATDVYLVSTGGSHTMTGDYTFTGTVTVPSPPVNPTDAASKAYVDSVVIGLDYKEAARAAADTNIPLAGATPLVVDGVTLVGGNRVLLFGQSSASQNGIYVFNDTSPTYTLTRAADALQGGINCGMFVFVANGIANGGYSYVMNTPDPITVDTTPLNFTIFNSTTSYLAGNGLQLLGNQFSVASTIATGSFVASGSVSTPAITSAGGGIDFSTKNISNVGTITAAAAAIPTINATGNTAIGGAGSQTTITGTTYADGDLTAFNLSTDGTLSIGAPNKVTISLSAAAPAARSYTLPVSAGGTAAIPIVSGAAATAPSVLVSSGSHIGTWQQSTIPPGNVTSFTTNSISTQSAATFATSTGTSMMFIVRVVARITSTGDTAGFDYTVAGKNTAGTLAVGASPPGRVVYDTAFSGNEVSFTGSGANLSVLVTPPTAAAVAWKVWIDMFAQ
jgi:hypothetical protein